MKGNENIKLVKRTKEFKVEVHTIFKDEKRDIIITDKVLRDNQYNKGKFLKYYKYKCNKCGYDEGWVLESSLLTNNQGCSCCAGRTVVQGINDIPTTAPWMIPYFQGGYEEAKLYTKTSNQKIYPICPDCNRIKLKEMRINTIHENKSIGCICSDGIRYPNKFMFSILNQMKIEFANEYSPNWIKPKRYDFYFKINNEEYIVEMDGGFHNKDNSMSGQSVEDSKYIDNKKDRLAEKHGIEVIRIDCCESDMDFIKDNILHSELNSLFDLSKVNWLECEKFALSNRIKEACELKKNNPDLSTGNIGKIMNLKAQTIRKYLIKGSKLGWCNYNPKEQKSRCGVHAGKLSGKRVKILKNGVLLGIFENCNELKRRSEELFGVKLVVSCISLVCNNKKPQYKGFTFEYVD